MNCGATIWLGLGELGTRRHVERATPGSAGSGNVSFENAAALAPAGRRMSHAGVHMRIASRCLTVILSGLISVGCARQPSTENSESPPVGDTTVASTTASPDLRSTRWQLVALGDK